LLFVALFLDHFGRFGLSDLCSVYFSVLHDPFGQFNELSSSERPAAHGELKTLIIQAEDDDGDLTEMTRWTKKAGSLKGIWRRSVATHTLKPSTM
jgi:hypothetical protein